MILKKRLAREIVGQFHSSDDAREAASYFESVVQGREIPEDIPVVSIQKIYPSSSGSNEESGVPEILVNAGMAESRSEAKRLINQGAVESDGEKVKEDKAAIRDGTIIKVGKRRWVKIVDADEKQ